MNDELGPPIPPPEDDLVLDRSLEALPRFKPSPSFADRVLARVFVPLPRWARAARDRIRNLLSGPRGWVTLGTFSVATAASCAMVIGVTITRWDAVAMGARIGLQPLGLRGWQDIRVATETYASAAATGLAQAVDALPMPFAALVGGYAMLTLVCLVALRRLTKAPAAMRAAR